PHPAAVVELHPAAVVELHPAAVVELHPAAVVELHPAAVVEALRPERLLPPLSPHFAPELSSLYPVHTP
ncbi:hypothetical protein, partial [Hydrogenimonas sp.]